MLPVDALEERDPGAAVALAARRPPTRHRRARRAIRASGPPRRRGTAPERRPSSRGQASNSYGGSASTRSTSSWRCLRRSRRRRRPGCARARPSCSMLSRRIGAPSRSRSTNVQWAAPRESASMPSAPVPANRSATRASRTRSRLPRALNTASRTLSVVGRVSATGGASIRRPRNSPATTRTASGYGRSIEGSYWTCDGARSRRSPASTAAAGRSCSHRPARTARGSRRHRRLPLQTASTAGTWCSRTRSEDSPAIEDR